MRTQTQGVPFPDHERQESRSVLFEQNQFVIVVNGMLTLLYYAIMNIHVSLSMNMSVYVQKLISERCVTNKRGLRGTTCNNTQFAREYDALALIELALIDSLVVYLSVDFHPLPTHPCWSLVASTTLRTRTQGQIKY